MPKRIVYTKITPLPANVPRQLALDMLHSHAEIIELNPLVTGHKPITAPRDAARDEYFAQWYEIEEIITWGFGMKKKIAFKGCFHDMPWGLQTHIYAPMGVDLRNKYQIAGNQPGEPKEVRELGVDAPAEGLYLKEDVEITCNIALASFVKKETKQTLLTMIERMTRKAELLDDGVLHAMFENGKLKTINPTQVQNKELLSSALADTPSMNSSPGSPPSTNGEFTPAHTFTKYSNLPGRMATPRTGVSPPMPGALEMDASESAAPILEMEGSTVPVPDGQEQYAYQGTDTAPGFHAELADTSGGFQPRRLSNLSFSSSARPNSQLAPSVYSHHSFEDRLSVVPPGTAITTGSHLGENNGRPRSTSASSYTVVNPDRPASQAAYEAYKRGAQDTALAGRVGGLNISGAPAPTR